MSRNSERSEPTVTTVADDSTHETYRVDHDWEDETRVSTALTAAIETVTGSDLHELPPLHEHVDPEALNRIFKPKADAPRQSSASRVRLRYAGFLVTIYADGEITFQPRGNTAEDQPNND